jgi:dTDP-4-amino-4,6-dideoxygalactose transaminase
MHVGLRDGILHEFREIIDANTFHHGPQLAAFEGSFASFQGSEYCVGVGSGVDALRLILLALDVGPGDEVIVPAATFIATFEAVTQVGATPVPADVRPDDYTLDLAAAAAAVTSSTRVIMPVHLYGQMADMARLRALATQRGVAVVEDACQAHGATRDGVFSGSGGIAGAFSFYPGKNLGAMGDGGAVITDDAELARRVRALGEHGQREKYHHETAGYTSRLDTLQAAVLLHKLPLLGGWNVQRSEAAAAYGELLPDVDGLTLPAVAEGARHVWHLYVVQTADPGGLAHHLRERGIGSGRHYPVPPHLSQAYEGLGWPRGSFPVTEALFARALSLPIFPGITSDQLAAVADAVRGFVEAR